MKLFKICNNNERKNAQVIQDMLDKGYTRINGREETEDTPEYLKRISHSGNYYPTLLSPDHNVRLAYEFAMLYLNQHQEAFFTGPDEYFTNVILIQGIVTRPEARQQGLASQVIQDLKDSAEKFGVKIQLHPTPMMQENKETEGMDKKQLIEWYKSKGFEQNKYETDDILTSDPNIEEPIK